MNKIDFVILWVDGNDPKWLSEKEKYKPSIINSENNNSNRFRDWNNLKYWFRAIEANASWVNNIFFITWGHIPSWLNTKNPKLKIVKHTDYIPKKYLPTYNSNVIELNLHRIKELNENFVLFNDDMFIMEKTKADDFFYNDLPCECYSETINYNENMNDIYTHTLLNNISIINKHFNKHVMYKKNWRKYFNLKYELRDILHSISLLPYSHFSLIENKHLPVSLKKGNLEKLWDIEYDNLNKCCLNRFRNLDDISQYLIRYYQLATGEFYPRKSNYGMYFALDDKNIHIIEKLEKRKYKIVCFNDTQNVKDFEGSKKILNNYLAKRYPNKSLFEI